MYYNKIITIIPNVGVDIELLMIYYEVNDFWHNV